MAATAAGMFNRLAMYFAFGVLLSTLVAVLLPYDLGILFLPAGLLVMAAGYVAGGAHSIRPARLSSPVAMSQTFARAEQDVRMYERDVDWNLVYGGFVVGTALVIAGLVAFFV